MGVNSLPNTVTRQRRGGDLNPGPSTPESCTLTTRLPTLRCGTYALSLSMCSWIELMEHEEKLYGFRTVLSLTASAFDAMTF